MSKIKIAICDDEPNVRSYLTSLIRRQDKSCEISEYADAASFLSACGAHDILFLDIELPSSASPDAMDGMTLARQLRGMNLTRQPIIIFVTGHESYIYEAFDVEAFQYLVKPIDEERFAAIFQRAAAKLSAEIQRQQKTLVVQSASVKRIIPLDNIYYIESQGHKVLLHLKDGLLESYARIGDLETRLAGYFARIHKGYLINLSYVEEYTRTEVTLSGGHRLMISKYKYDDFVKTHLRFLQH